MRLVATSVAVVCLTALLLPGLVSAQERASIVGTVQDSTRGVLPGVTVTASSPVLIEQARMAVTDSSGRYAIIDLRPGSYVVTFSLAGFKTVSREGIVLEGAFAARVNAALEVGQMEEKLTVTGDPPVVDLQAAQNQTVLNRQALDVLPAARTMQGGASLVPGVSYYNQGFTSNMSFHGSLREDQHIYFDGMNIGQNLTQNGQQANGVGVNELAQAELVYDAGSLSAEVAVGGVRMDSIPKEGGNDFAGSARVLYSSGSLQSDNITSELRPFIKQGNALDYFYDANVVFGGPLQKNKLWFLVAQRVTQANNLIPLPEAYFPQGGTADSGGQRAPHSTVRLTYQANPRNKLSLAVYNSSGGTQRFDVGCTATSFNSVSCVSPEAAYSLPTPVQYAVQGKWTSPITSRLLLEVGQSMAVSTYKFKYQDGVGPYDVQHFNQSTSVRTVATGVLAPMDYFNRTWNTVANLSYVTGSHAIKGGLNYQWGFDTTKVEPHGDLSVLTYTNDAAGIARPSTASLRNTPLTRRNNLNAQLGLFVQDRWMLHRLTLSYGARFDYFNASAPEQSATPGRFISPEANAARQDIPAVECLPCWKDWSVRLGGSYDLFGNGKTALKVSLGKFLGQQALGLAAAVNPLATQTDTRAWTDLDGNGSVLDSNGNPQFNELGPTRNRNFGLPAGGTQFDPALPRPYNWEGTVSVQHELMSRVSVTAGFYRRQFYNIQYTKNTAVDPVADYTAFTITAPRNPNLPGGGGQAITMYNLNPNKLGAVNNVLTWSTKNTRVYNGVEVSTNARLPHGGFLFGGVTLERTATDNCADLALSNPNNLRFCRQVPPFQALYKASAAYSLPYDVIVSMTFQARPGISIGSGYSFGSAVAGVALTGGGTLTTTVVDPTSQYYGYVKTLDARIAKSFRAGQTRVQPFVEIFNVPNFSTVLTVNETVGPNYFQPGNIVQGRRFQVGATVDF